MTCTCPARCHSHPNPGKAKRAHVKATRAGLRSLYSRPFEPAGGAPLEHLGTVDYRPEKGSPEHYAHRRMLRERIKTVPKRTTREWFGLTTNPNDAFARLERQVESEYRAKGFSPERASYIGHAVAGQQAHNPTDILAGVHPLVAIGVGVGLLVLIGKATASASASISTCGGNCG